MCEKKDGKFTWKEIAETAKDDVIELLSSGEADMTSPEHVYNDVKRIVAKLEEKQSK